MTQCLRGFTISRTVIGFCHIVIVFYMKNFDCVHFFSCCCFHLLRKSTYIWACSIYFLPLLIFFCLLPFVTVKKVFTFFLHQSIVIYVLIKERYLCNNINWRVAPCLQSVQYVFYMLTEFFPNNFKICYLHKINSRQNNIWYAKFILIDVKQKKYVIRRRNCI